MLRQGSRYLLRGEPLEEDDFIASVLAADKFDVGFRNAYDFCQELDESLICAALDRWSVEGNEQDPFAYALERIAGRARRDAALDGYSI